MVLHARPTDPDTSHAAARMARSLASAHCRIIVDAIRAAGRPLAAEEVAEITELDKVAVAKRWADLRDVLEDSGERHTNQNGRRAARYRIREEQHA